jgi:CO/xanthine dehydrogenase Mo-binding subunit
VAETVRHGQPVFHAIGKRVRSLPIRIENVLTG